MREYREREYRSFLRCDRLLAFEVRVKETDLFILADSDLQQQAVEAVYRIRGPLENYVADHPEFLHSLTPLPVDPLAPAVVREMTQAGRLCGTGPMAAVAGAIAERVGKELLETSSEVVVENGGDCFVKVNMPMQFGIFAGDSPLSGKVAVWIRPEQTPLGICTSSATVGHSLSFGRADAVTVVAASTAVADAAATRICNEVHNRADIKRALELAQRIEGVRGAVVVIKDRLGAWGDIELVDLPR
ncbi:MAG: UPF0280 family protein [Deltaproteobacteria bacterium]|nr:UPF0280 family protein [Deltaproteobacteria bacterium]MBW2070669.1 UPF0280 family protein [Deltaproteobacteria bacterium]